jgi:hypothetical protein
MQITNYQLHQLKDLEISYFLIMPYIDNSGFVCHVRGSGLPSLLITQKNVTRVFKTLDSAYKALLPICKSKCAEFKVGFNVDDNA